MVSVATLALGLGAAIGLGAYASALLWPRLDAPDPERIVRLDGADGMQRSLPFSYPDFVDYREGSRTLEPLAGYSIFGAMVESRSAGAEKGAAKGEVAVRHGWAQTVTGNFFELFAARPAYGRLLAPDDERPGAQPVVVLGWFFWRHRLGADPHIVGRQIRINDQPVTVVGVVEEGFQGLIPAAVYVPVTLRDAVTGRAGQLRDRQSRWLSPVARLAPGGTVEEAVARATAELRGISRALDQSHPRPVGDVGSTGTSREAGRRVSVIPVLAPDPFDRRMASAARILMAGAVLLLLLACANVGNLVLARTTAQRRQLGIRAALGASRGRLVGQRVGEGAVLVLAALPWALVLARWLAHQMEGYVQTTPVGFGDWAPGHRLVHFDAGIWALTAVLSLVALASIAVAPAVQALRFPLSRALRADPGGGFGGGSGSRVGTGRWGLRQGLVVLQVALAALLLVGSGLLGRSLWQARSVDPGFDSQGLVLATLFVPRTVGFEGASDPPALTFYRDLLGWVRELPGVRAAALTRHAPLGGLDTVAGILPATAASTGERSERSFETSYTLVSTGYFETLGLDLLAGRSFDARDRRNAPRTAVVNRAFAEAYGNGSSPVGRALLLPARFGGRSGAGTGAANASGEASIDIVFDIVGVVENARLGDLLDPPTPTVFLPFEQHLRPRMQLLMRVDGPTAPLAASLRGWLREHPLGVGLITVAPFEEQMRWALFYPRMNAWMAIFCGLVGLVLAVTGVGSVLAHAVTRRRREMGVRQALGASPAAIRRLAHRESLRLVALGLVLGVAGGALGARWLESLLYGVEAWDLPTFLAVPVLLLGTALLAADLPARRAARVDPREALTAE